MTDPRLSKTVGRAGCEQQSSLRALRVLRELQRRWCRVAELAALMDTDQKTIRRDLSAIRRAGFRLRMKIEDYGRKAYRQR